MKKLTMLADQNGGLAAPLASDYVDARVLAATTAEVIAKPVGSSKVVFSTNFVAGDTITFGNVTLTAVAAAPSTQQFIPSGTLALTLAALVILLQAQYTGLAGTFTVTDTNTSITLTNTTAAQASTVSAKKASGTVVATQNHGPRFARLNGTVAFWYNPNGAAAIPAADVVNGTSSILLNPQQSVMLAVEDIASIGVIASAICAISIEWFA